MNRDEEDVSLLEEYWGMPRKTLTALIALIASVLVVVTGIYISIFGFQHWKTNMKRAGSMMVINFQTPVARTEAAPYVCPHCGQKALMEPPQNGGVPACPDCGTPMNPGR